MATGELIENTYLTWESAHFIHFLGWIPYSLLQQQILEEVCIEELYCLLSKITF